MEADSQSDVIDSLIVKNFSKSSPSTLVLYIERVLDDAGIDDITVDEDSITFSPDHDQAHVPLSQPISVDLHVLQTAARNSRFKPINNLELDLIPRPRLLVYNIHKKHDTDVLELYLEDKSSVSCEITSENRDLSKRAAIIFFDQETDIDRVVSLGPHKIMGEQIYLRKCTPFTTLDNFDREMCHPDRVMPYIDPTEERTSEPDYAYQDLPQPKPRSSSPPKPKPRTTAKSEPKPRTSPIHEPKPRTTAQPEPKPVTSYHSEEAGSDVPYTDVKTETNSSTPDEGPSPRRREFSSPPAQEYSAQASVNPPAYSAGYHPFAGHEPRVGHEPMHQPDFPSYDSHPGAHSNMGRGGHGAHGHNIPPLSLGNEYYGFPGQFGGGDMHSASQGQRWHPTKGQPASRGRNAPTRQFDSLPSASQEIRDCIDVEPEKASIFSAVLKFNRELRQAQKSCTVGYAKSARNRFQIEASSEEALKYLKQISFKILNGMVSDEVDLSLELADKLTEAGGRSALINEFRAMKPRQVCARVYVKNGAAYIMGYERRDAREAKKFLENLPGMNLPLSSDQEKKMKTPEKKKALKAIGEQSQSAVVYVSDSKIYVEGLEKIVVDKLYAEVKALVPDEKTCQSKVPMPSVTYQLLKEFGKEDLDRLLSKRGDDAVSWRFAEDDTLILTGTRQAVTSGTGVLKNSPLMAPYTQEATINKEGLNMADFNSAEMNDLIEKLGKSNRCVIQTGSTQTSDTTHDIPASDQRSDEDQSDDDDDSDDFIIDDDDDDDHIFPEDDDDNGASEELQLTSLVKTTPANLEILRGDIAKYKADILVNTIANDNQDLNKCGALSQSFAKAGGAQFQQDFTNNIGQVRGGTVQPQSCPSSLQASGLQYHHYANQLQTVSQKALARFTGSVAPAYSTTSNSTSGYGSLQCRFVFHMGIRSWAKTSRRTSVDDSMRRRTDSTSKQDLMTMIDTCLRTAVSYRMQTIAFPTIGGGKFGYPVEEVADSFMQVLPKYPNLQVKIVAFDGPSCYKYKKCMGIIPNKPARHSRGGRNPGRARRTKPPPRPRSQPHSHTSYDIPSVNVRFKVHSLERENIDKAIGDIHKYALPMVYKEETISLSEHSDKTEIIRTFAKYGCKTEVSGKSLRVKGGKLRVEKAMKECSSIAKTPQVVKMVAPPSADPSSFTMAKLKEIKDTKGPQKYLEALSSETILSPDYWKNSPKMSIMKLLRGSSTSDFLVDVSRDSRSYNAIHDLVMKSWNSNYVGHGRDAVNLGHSTIAIQKIQRLENPNLYKDYATKRATFCLQASMNKPFAPISLRVNAPADMVVSEINEVYLFHGTSTDKLTGMYTHGIDDRLSGDAAMFGKGSYFAESSTKADQYADNKHARVQPGQQLHMIVARVLLGNMYNCQQPQNFRRAPCTQCKVDDCTKQGHTLYDSVLGTHKNATTKLLFREFVIYDKAQCYPEYIVQYVRQ